MSQTMQKNKFYPKNDAVERLRPYYNGNSPENPKIDILRSQ